MVVNQMFPSRSATNPCAPESGVLSGNSLMVPVFGSRRPSLFAICPVYQREPSGASAGSCGREFAVGRSNSLIDTFAGLAANVTVTATAISAINLRRLMISSEGVDAGQLSSFASAVYVDNCSLLVRRDARVGLTG